MTEPPGSSPPPRRRLSKRERWGVVAALVAVGAIAWAAKALWRPASPGPEAPGPATPEAAVPAPTALERLRESLVSGRGMSDPRWPEIVQESALEVWTEPSYTVVLATEVRRMEGAEARKLHTDLAHVAGDVARDPDARADWAARDPDSVVIHHGFVAATGRGPEAFRAWVMEDGEHLRRRRMERLSSERPPR